MTYRAWWAARWFLFDEKFGPSLRAAELEARQQEAKLTADYARSVALLRKDPDGDR